MISYNVCITRTFVSIDLLTHSSIYCSFYLLSLSLSFLRIGSMPHTHTSLPADVFVRSIISTNDSKKKKKIKYYHNQFLFWSEKNCITLFHLQLTLAVRGGSDQVRGLTEQREHTCNFSTKRVCSKISNAHFFPLLSLHSFFI